jgi:hypothetical protein
MGGGGSGGKGGGGSSGGKGGGGGPGQKGGPAAKPIPLSKDLQAGVARLTQKSGRSSAKLSGSDIRQVNGSIGEIRGYYKVLEKGHIGIKPPKNTNVPGPDFITYNKETKSIVIWDAKYRKEGGRYPSSVPAKKMKRWMPDIRNAVNSLPPGSLREDALDALENDRISSEIFKWPQ